MKLDLSAAWNQTMAYIMAHKTLLMAIAGIFLVVPQIAGTIFGGQPPQPEAGQSPDQMMNDLRAYYMTALPWLLIMAIGSMIATVAMLKILLDPARPTVGEAIKGGFKGVLPYVIAQLITAIGMAVAAGIPLGIAGAIGSIPLLVIVGMVAFAAIAYVSIKLIFIPALIADRDVTNPIELIKQSWAMTKGNSILIFVFLLLVAVVFFVAILIVSMIAGLVFALAAGPELGVMLTGVVTAFLSAALSVVICAMVAAMYRQLTGSAAGVGLEKTFD